MTGKRLSRQDARLQLDLPLVFSRDDVERAFRLKARDAHPDAGGDTETFRTLVQCRETLTANLDLPHRVVTAENQRWTHRLRHRFRSRSARPKRVQ
jgi:hypothetical protein